MSAHNLPLELSRRAQRDIRTILAYTLEQWGEEQEARYAEALHKALNTISAYPESGRSREEFGAGYRSFVVEQHVVFYRISADTIYVVRIVDGRMDPKRALRGR